MTESELCLYLIFALPHSVITPWKKIMRIADFLAVFPMKGKGQARLVGAVRQYIPNHGDLTWDDVSSLIIQHLKMELEGVKWFSTYHVHHRVAAAFQKQRIFLLGDAAHIRRTGHDATM